MTRTWLVTGASRGIGRLLTEELLARGDRVAATVRDRAGMADLVAIHGDLLWVTTLDVSDAPRVRIAVDEAFAAMGRVDVVVSNAGYGIYAAAEEISDAQLLHIVATNLIGSMQVARAALPHLRQQGGGHLVQMSSMAGHFAKPGFAAYHATKWGIEGFYEALAAEVAPFGVTTTVVAPGRFPTSFYDAAQRPDPHPAYADQAQLQRAQADPDDMPGDPHRLVELIISLGGTEQPPRRLLLGSDAYAMAHESLHRRLQELEEQEQVAYSTDRVRT